MQIAGCLPTKIICEFEVHLEVHFHYIIFQDLGGGVQRCSWLYECRNQKVSDPLALELPGICEMPGLFRGC